MDWFLCDNGLRHQRVNVRVLNPVKIYSVEYRNFTKFPGGENIRKGTVLAKGTVSVRKFSTPGN